MKTAELLKQLAEILAPLGEDIARNDAKIIVAHLYDCSLNRVFLIPEATEEQTARAIEIAEKRKDRYPLQYILGEAHFMGRKYKVTPDVLIPRSDTEPMVEEIIRLLQDKPAANVADICCGSGCIGIAIAEALPQVKVTASDLYSNVLNIARENAEGVPNIQFLRGDLYTPHMASGVKYDLIVSNPPYLTQTEMDDLQTEVGYEPKSALFGGADGLDFYKRLIEESAYVLKLGGYLVFEHGFEQQQAIVELLQAQKMTVVKRLKDWGGNDRAVFAIKPQ